MNYKALLPVLSFCCIAAMLVTSCSSKARMETIQFATDRSSLSDSEKIVKNFKKQNDIYVLTQFGTYDSQMKWLNHYLLTSVSTDSVKSKRMCSIFFTTNNSGLTFHCQNLDNPESGILVGSYAPPGKYRSVAITRMTDITYFPPSFEFDDMNEMQKTFLPFFAFYPSDGINEQGLSVSIAGCYQHQVKEKKNRTGVFVTYLNRLILDSCKNVDEALALAKRYYFFDHPGLIACNHIMVADRSGNSAVIEYNKDGKMQYVVNHNSNLVITNDDVVGQDTSQLAAKCKRYKAICRQLSAKPVRNYVDCMNILNSVQNQTLWSVVMDNQNNTGYIAVKGKYNHFYQFSLR
jgi:Acyl-coenzyme A:6-aminopenicillanic acid acyl-transferase